MRLLFAFLGMTALLAARAQQTVDVSRDGRVGPNMFNVVNGTPFVNVKFVNLVEGTPYFHENWMKGILIGTDGYEYKDQQLKIDLVDNQIHFLDEKQTELVSTTPAKEVILTNAEGDNFRFVKASSLPATNPPLKAEWFLWLHTGNASLYKYFQKVAFENRPYGSATTELKIRTTERYFVLYNNSLLEIRKLKDAPAVLANKKAELEEFLKNKDDKNSSMDDRFLRLIEYYNSLFPAEKKQ